jgi:hypothetical protein
LSSPISCLLEHHILILARSGSWSSLSLASNWLNTLGEVEPILGSHVLLLVHKAKRRLPILILLLLHPSTHRLLSHHGHLLLLHLLCLGSLIHKTWDSLGTLRSHLATSLATWHAQLVVHHLVLDLARLEIRLSAIKVLGFAFFARIFVHNLIGLSKRLVVFLCFGPLAAVDYSSVVLVGIAAVHVHIDAYDLITILNDIVIVVVSPIGLPLIFRQLVPKLLQLLRHILVGVLILV